MLKKIFLSNIALCLILFISPSAFAKPQISLSLESQKVVVNKDTKKEIFSEAKDLKPGDVILYKIKVTNSGDTAAIEVKPIGNIPDKTVYLTSTKTSFKTLFSIDKGASFSEKPKISIREKGKDIVKDAPVEMYNKIQWLINKINPSQVIEITYKVKVK